MNKGELIEAVANNAGISKALAGKVLDSALDAVTKSLSKGDRVALVGFGTFSVNTRKARSGRNPRSGESIKIPAKRTAKFKPGSALKVAVR